MSTNALRRGLTLSMRASSASTISTGETLRLRISAACSVADSQFRSLSGMGRSSGLEMIHDTVSTASPRASEARIQRVAQGVAEQVAAEHREADGDAREQHEMRRLLRVLRGGDGQHAPPRGVRLRDPMPRNDSVASTRMA